MNEHFEGPIGRRGEVVIPKPIREAFDWQPGTDVTFNYEGDRIVIRESTDVLDEYLEAIPKCPEPEAVDWDERHYRRSEG